MIDAFGGESEDWVGKSVKVHGIMSNVQGKMTKVYYFAHPDAVINEEGDFVIPKHGGEDSNENIPF
jgi:hypothetical protein